MKEKNIYPKSLLSTNPQLNNAILKESRRACNCSNTGLEIKGKSTFVLVILNIQI